MSLHNIFYRYSIWFYSFLRFWLFFFSVHQPAYGGSCRASAAPCWINFSLVKFDSVSSVITGAVMVSVMVSMGLARLTILQPMVIMLLVLYHHHYHKVFFPRCLQTNLYRYGLIINFSRHQTVIKYTNQISVNLFFFTLYKPFKYSLPSLSRWPSGWHITWRSFIITGTSSSSVLSGALLRLLEDTSLAPSGTHRWFHRGRSFGSLEGSSLVQPDAFRWLCRRIFLGSVGSSLLVQSGARR